MNPRPPLTALLAALALVAPGAGRAGQDTYVGKDASRCEIFRALSAQVPDDCLEDKSPVIHPPAAGSAPPRPQVPALVQAPPPEPAGPRHTRPAHPPHQPPARPAAPRPAPAVAAHRPAAPVTHEHLPPPRVIPTGERAMSTPIEFAFDSERLTPTARRQLDNIAAVLKDPLLRGLVVRIEGHTDAIGAADYNLDLSRRRARSVQDYLASAHGIDPRRIPATGRGASDPFDPAHPRAGINRRVQFVNAGLTL